MTECVNGEMRDRLVELAHGLLDPATRALVERHVASCDACAAELELVRALGAALARGPAVDVDRIVAAVNRDAPTGAGAPRSGDRWRPFAWRPASLPMRIAAGLVVAAFGAAGIILATGDSGRAPEQVVVTPRTSPERGPDSAVAGSASTQEPSVARGSGALNELGGALAQGGGIGEMNEQELRALLADLDRITGVPDAEPLPAVPTLVRGES